MKNAEIDAKLVKMYSKCTKLTLYAGGQFRYRYVSRLPPVSFYRYDPRIGLLD